MVRGRAEQVGRVADREAHAHAGHLGNFVAQLQAVGKELSAAHDAGKLARAGPGSEVLCEYCGARLSEDAYALHVRSHINAPVTRTAAGVVIL